MKKQVIAVGGLVIACAIAVCGAASAKSPVSETNTLVKNASSGLEPVTLVLADSSTDGAAGQLFDEAIAKYAAELTDGRLTINLKPNGEAGDDVTLIQDMQSGAIDMVGCQTAPMVSFILELSVFDLPLVFAGYDGDTIDAALNNEDSKFNRTIQGAYEYAGLHLLGFLQDATYRLTTSNKELSNLEAFEGLKIRTMENANHISFWKALQAEPKQLPWSKVYNALESGEIEAEENAADTIKGANLDKVQKFASCTNHSLYCNQVCINAEKFTDLDPFYQDALQDAVKLAMEDVRPKLKEMDESSKAELRKRGMTITEYGQEFFDEVLALDDVQALYLQINEATDGLGVRLQDELAGK